MRSILFALTVFLLSIGSCWSQIVITTAGYSQNFNGIGSGLPVGWSVRTGATSTALGTTTTFTSAKTAWATPSIGFANFAASTGLSSSASSTIQDASTDRALGVRPAAASAQGLSFDFNFSTVGVQITAISFDLMTLVVRNSTYISGYSIEYGVGATPSSWTTLGSYSSNGSGAVNPGSFGATPFNLTGFGTALDNQSNAWIRVWLSSAPLTSGTPNTVAIDNFSMAATAVPEPSSIVLLGIAGAVFFIAVRRAHRKAFLNLA